MVTVATVASAGAVLLLGATTTTIVDASRKDTPRVAVAVANRGEVTVDLRSVASRTDEEWACATLDWWPSDKCDHGRCPWGDASLATIDLDAPRLRAAVRALAPLRLRLGGSLGDSVTYETDDDDDNDCLPFSAPTNATSVGYEIGTGCLTRARWDALDAFCRDVGCNVVFGINALRGRHPPDPPCPAGTNCRRATPPRPDCCTNWTGAWDPSNARSFLEHVASRREDTALRVLEFGNELVGPYGIEARLEAADYARDFSVFRRTVDEVMGVGKVRTAAPDCAFNPEWYEAFLGNLTASNASWPDVLTTHNYTLGAGIDPSDAERAVDADALDGVAHYADAAEVFLERHRRENENGHDRLDLWVGEAGGAYNSGRHSVTDAFVSGFWYLDAMGTTARRGHKSYCRQTLVGGDYGLLDASNDLAPNPDYHALRAWKKTMGTGSYDAVVSDDARSWLRAYAHETARESVEDDDNDDPTSITLLLLNLDSDRAAEVVARERSSDDDDSTISLTLLPRDEYEFTSASLDARVSRLDGVDLVTSSSSPDHLPELTPRRATSSTIRLPPSSYGFYVVRRRRRRRSSRNDHDHDDGAIATDGGERKRAVLWTLMRQNRIWR